MNLSHRLPLPSLEDYSHSFSSNDASMAFRDCQLRNTSRVADALKRLNRYVPTLNEVELFAAFIAARLTMQSNAPRVRLETIPVFYSLSKTYLQVHVVPYIYLLTHDDNQSVKTEAAKGFTQLCKDIGGLKQCLPQLISAIGAMGATAFEPYNELNADDIMAKSRLACSAMLAASQLLAILSNEIDRKSSAELIQYLKKPLQGIKEALKATDSSPITLFYNQRLRCCLYRLQKETCKIEKCPKLCFKDLIEENDPQCLKYVIPLIEAMDPKDISYEDLPCNPDLLNHFIDSYLQNSSPNQLKTLFLSGKLSDENFAKAINHLISNGWQDYIDYTLISNSPQIWNLLPSDIVNEASKKAQILPACYLIEHPELFSSIEIIDPSSDPNDIVNLICSQSEQSAIPIIVSKYQNLLPQIIENWTKSPKTDWWFKESIDLYSGMIKDHINSLSLTVPTGSQQEFQQMVDKTIINLIESNKDINPDLWKHAALGNDLINLIITKQYEIKADNETKQMVYNVVFHDIETSKDDAEAGLLIGKLASSSETLLNEFPKSFSFMEHYFSEVDINDAPNDVELDFLDGYLSKEFPNFEITLFTQTFQMSRLSKPVMNFLSKLEAKKRQVLFTLSLETQRFAIALLLIATTEETLEVPKLIVFAPFLAIIPRYRSWFDSLDELPESDQIFSRFMLNPLSDQLPQIDHSMILFATSLTDRYDPDTVYEIADKKIESAEPIDYYIILASILRHPSLSTPDKYIPMIIKILSHLHSLPHINTPVLDLLTKYFVISAQLPLQSLTEFLLKASVLLQSDIIKCLQAAIPLYIEKYNEDQCYEIRLALSRGQITSLILFDEAFVPKFVDIPEKNLLPIMEKFPNAASKWYKKHPNPKILEYVIHNVTPILMPKMIKLAVDAAEKIEGVKVTAENNNIYFECGAEDDVFKLRISIPSAYPLESPNIDVFSLGKVNLTQEIRDEVIKESLRPNGFSCAISTWKARIQNIVSSENQCPICMSLLDQNGELPTARCHTCHQCCHHSCLKDWLNNSLKKTCPWCRGEWKKPKGSKRTPKRAQSYT